MDITIDESITMAIEVRRSCFGYAVFRGSDGLLDWGATTPYPCASAVQRAKKRLQFLLRILRPAAVVMRNPCKLASCGSMLSMLKREVTKASVSFSTLSRDAVNNSFRSYQVKNKYQIAEALAEIFPDLIFKLPPMRDTGDSERHAMVVFDAIATGYAHFAASAAEGAAFEVIESQ